MGQKSGGGAFAVRKFFDENFRKIFKAQDQSAVVSTWARMSLSLVEFGSRIQTNQKDPQLL